VTDKKSLGTRSSTLYFPFPSSRNVLYLILYTTLPTSPRVLSPLVHEPFVHEPFVHEFLVYRFTSPSHQSPSLSLCTPWNPPSPRARYRRKENLFVLCRTGRLGADLALLCVCCSPYASSLYIYHGNTFKSGGLSKGLIRSCYVTQECS